MSGAKSYKSKIELYTSIDDLPVFNFWELCGKNYKYLVKSGKYSGEELKEDWYKIYNEFIDLFGLSSQFRMIADTQLRIQRLKIKRIVEEKRSLDSAIRVEERQLQEQMFKTVDQLSNEKQIIHLEKYFNTSIDPKKCPTKKFYTYIKMID